MSLCNILRHPPKPRWPEARGWDLAFNLFDRGRKVLHNDETTRLRLEQVCLNTLRTFLQQHGSEIAALTNRLDQILKPWKPQIDNFFLGLGGKSDEAAKEHLLTAVLDFFEQLDPDKMEAALTELFDLIYEEMQAGVEGLFSEWINPVVDELVALLEDDFADGLTDSSAFNRFLLAKDLKQLKAALQEMVETIPPYTRNGYLYPVITFLKNSRFLSQIEKVREVVTDSKNVIDKLLELIKTVSANVDAPGPGPGRYLWYASWLLKDHYWEIEQRICRGPLFTLKNDFVGELDNAQLSPDLLDDFQKKYALSGTPAVELLTTGEAWQLRGKSGDPDFYLLRLKGTGKIKVYRIFTETDWTRIAPMQSYTFKAIPPETADDWAYHTSWLVDLIKMILHALSMEPTKATGVKSDVLSNLGNMLLRLTYGGLKLAGPKGGGWNRTDPHVESFWARIALPFFTTLFASLEGVPGKANNGQRDTRLNHWLNLAGKDFGELLLIDHWCQLLRDGLLAYITVANYEGAKPAPADLPDTRPLNRLAIPALAALSTELACWWAVAAFPKRSYGFPVSNPQETGSGLLPHWLGTGSLLSIIATICGVKTIENFGQVEDHHALCRSLKRGIGSLWLKFPVYYYLANEGSTNRGRLSHDGYLMPGYGVAATSPYRLPFPKDTIYQCIQGNMGMWNHNAWQAIPLFYAYDFALDWNDPVIASRSGIVWSLCDEAPAEEEKLEYWQYAGNYLQLLHTKPEELHDRNQQKKVVPTFAEYRHGRSGSIGEVLPQLGLRPVSSLLNNSALKTAFLDYGIDLQVLYEQDHDQKIAVKLDGFGQAVGPYAVSRGKPVMRAGQTGKVAFNQVHLHVQPARLNEDGCVLGPEAYSIPFVFREVPARMFSRAGVPRTGHYYQAKEIE